MRRRSRATLAVCVLVAAVLLAVLGRWWLRRDLPPPIPADTPLIAFQEDRSIAPLPHEVDVTIDGRTYPSLHLEPGLSYRGMALPDFPQIVEADGTLPDARRVIYYDCSVNRHGLRGPRSYARERPEDGYRVLVVGTGVTFGEGVTDEETFSARLEQLLDRDPPLERDFEVINSGIPCLTADRALGVYLERSREFQVDRWVISIGVNDALPMFERSTDDFRRDVRTLVSALRELEAPAVFLVEPVNSFYPWLQRYGPYRDVLDDEVLPHFDLLDVASVLDCHERRDGLRLEVDGDLQRVVQYREGQPRKLARARYQAGEMEPYIAPAIYEYLDGHQVWMRTFITDVHLNPFGHEVVAGVLYDYLAARLRGEPPPELEVEGCGVDPRD